MNVRRFLELTGRTAGLILVGTSIGSASGYAQTVAQRFSANAAADQVQTYFMTDVAGNRKQPEFDSVPILIGDYAIHPTLQLNANYDGNWINRSDTVDLNTGIPGALPALMSRFGQSLPPVLLHQIGLLHINPHVADHADEELDFDPGVSVKTESDGNAISFDATGRFFRYAKLKREDRIEWHSDLVGQIALGEKQNITLIAGADSRAEAPGANGTAVLDYYGFGPSIHTSPTASANLNLTFGRVLGQFTVSYTRDYYSTLHLRAADLLNATGLAALASASPPVSADVPLSQDFRNDQNPQMLANLTYNLNTESQFFIQGTYQYVNELAPPASRPGNPSHPFDTHTYGFLVGVAQSLDRVIVYQIGIGWQFHRYVDPFYQNTSRIALDGAIDWYPTQLLSFRVQTAQTYSGSAVYGVGDVSVRTLTVRADYEFRPNIEVWALWSTEWDHYPIGAGTTVVPDGAMGTTGTAAGSAITLQSANFEIDYRPNRLLEIGLNAGYHNRASQDPIVLGAFTAFRAGLTVTLRH